MLKYVGDGSFLPGIPARDLTDEEIKQLGLTEKELIKSGLYEEGQPHPHPVPFDRLRVRKTNRRLKWLV